MRFTLKFFAILLALAVVLGGCPQETGTENDQQPPSQEQPSTPDQQPETPQDDTDRQPPEEETDTVDGATTNGFYGPVTP